MASVQCHKPSGQTNHQVQYTTCHEKSTTTEVTCHHNMHWTANNDHHNKHGIANNDHHNKHGTANNDHHNKHSTTHNDHHNKHGTANNDHHSFTEKMKEMANTARKMFNHEGQHGPHGPNTGHHGSHVPNNGHVPDHTKKPACAGTAQDGLNMKKNKTKKPEGYGGNCLPKMHRKAHKEGKHGNGSSSSDSEDESCRRKQH